VARGRARWQRHQARIDPRRLVFVDETWTRTNMGALRGWGLVCPLKSGPP
jgi:putative transposase